MIAPSEYIACCIFAIKSARKRGSTGHSQPGSYYSIKYIRVFVEEMYIIRCGEKPFFSRLERTQTPGRKNSKSQGVVMTSDRNSEAR